MYDYICLECGALLDYEELIYITEDYGWEHKVCPCCKCGALDDCDQCIDCEKYFGHDEIYEGRCHDCDIKFEESDVI